MIKFSEFVSEVIVSEKINKANWTALKAFMKKQPGFKSWEFEGDYEELVIGFKSNKQATDALKKSMADTVSIGAFGPEARAQNSEITVILGRDAMKAMDESVNEVKQLDREDLEGVAADKVMRELEKDKNSKTQSKVDYDGKQVDTIMTKTAMYIVYYDYGDEVMRIIKNPNKKDMKEYKDGFESS